MLILLNLSVAGFQRDDTPQLAQFNKNSGSTNAFTAMVRNHHSLANLKQNAATRNP
jgi:hypothetical protein